MKIRILLTLIGVATLASIAFNTNAGSTLLSPRALGNQIKVDPGVMAAQPAAVVQSGSPRAIGNQTRTVAGVANEATPAMACISNMSGNPKTIQACAEHPAIMPGCNPVAIAR
ncbi:MAG: hypothetical protein WAO02_07400 [Verrucomicrobiia bacterium]